jgi:hypothetical protein
VNNNQSANKPAGTPAPSAAPQANNDLATAAAVAGANKKSVAEPTARTYPEIGRVRSKVGDMMHLHQNVMITGDEKKIKIDGFARAQLDAGKWELVTD